MGAMVDSHFRRHRLSQAYLEWVRWHRHRASCQQAGELRVALEQLGIPVSPKVSPNSPPKGSPKVSPKASPKPSTSTAADQTRLDALRAVFDDFNVGGAESKPSCSS